jgi:streptomycin 6-kinase
MPASDLPTAFRNNVIGAFPNGAAWLEALPELIAECASRWRLSIEEPFELSFSYVARARTADGQPVVLKIAVPNAELISGIQALQCYDGRGAVRLLEFDCGRGFLLMERLTPGKMLTSLKDEEHAARIAAGVMRALWRPLPPKHPFPIVAQWADGLKKLRFRFDGGTGPFPLRLVAMADSLFKDLLSSSEPPVLLHGDLHHFNVLSTERNGWLAIDPKGVSGERAYEAGAFLRNPSSAIFKNPRIQRMRTQILAEELGLDKDRILGWSVAQAVLSAWWSFEDSAGDWEAALACAEVLARLMCPEVSSVRSPVN